MERLIRSAVGIHAKIVNDALPSGGTLTCTRCGRTRRVSTAECADYLAYGWPKCCGKTMYLSREQEKPNDNAG